MKMYLLIAVVGMSQIVQAQPEVIADFGGRETGLKSPRQHLLEAAAKTRLPSPDSPVQSAGVFPVQSALRVGIIENHHHDLPVTRPFFIVGADEQSRQWLATNKAHLKTINAIGFVTNVASQDVLEKLQHSVGDLELYALPVDSIADQFSLKSYPVLITQSEILQ